MKRIYFLFFALTSSMMFSQIPGPDLECLVFHNPLSVQTYTTPEPFLWGQGFIAECDGYVGHVEYFAAFPGIVPAGTLNILEGNDLNNINSIYSQPHDEIQIPVSGFPIRIDLTDDLFLEEGVQYTFEFTVDQVGAFGSIEPEDYEGGIILENRFMSFPLADFQFTVSLFDEPVSNLSIEDVINENTISIFPNPTTEFIQVSGLNLQEDYTIYSILGAEVKSGSISNQEQINVSDLANGLYVLRLNNGRTIKFLKQ